MGRIPPATRDTVPSEQTAELTNFLPVQARSRWSDPDRYCGTSPRPNLQPRR